MHNTQDKKWLIISGRSGSGKTVCLRSLEDLGFYCIDNLPMTLFPELIHSADLTQNRIAVSLDARNLPSKEQLHDILLQIKHHPHWEILYFDADDNILLKRFSETRRKHPLSNDQTSLQEAIQQEKTLLESIANAATLFIDTSHLSEVQLRHLIRERIAARSTDNLSILFQSFGYKNGIPADADYVFDLRCLPNPYWQDALRPLTGQDQAVIDFLEHDPLVTKMFTEITHFLDLWIPYYEKDKRSYLTINLGCTGGRHRSVYFAQRLAQYYQKKYQHVQVRHRDLQAAHHD
jgi:RNase adapter protein RapZ